MTNETNYTSTDGGANIEGNANVGNDLIGRDQFVVGGQDNVQGNKIVNIYTAKAHNDKVSSSSTERKLEPYTWSWAVLKAHPLLALFIVGTVFVVITIIVVNRADITTHPRPENEDLLLSCPVSASYDPTLNLDDKTMTIPSTTFTMGESAIGLLEHIVSVDEFEIDTYEVTNFQYKRFIDATGNVPPGSWKGNSFIANKAFDPVTDVTWVDASAYCRWLGKRLPTEAEWELACRGEASNIYPWGNMPNPRNANTIFSGCTDTVAVGTFSPNGDSPYSVADLVGNVSEWVSSPEISYPYLVQNEEIDSNNIPRVIRGGDWLSSDDLARCSMRQSGEFETEVSWVGFRCAKSKVIHKSKEDSP